MWSLWRQTHRPTRSVLDVWGRGTRPRRRGAAGMRRHDSSAAGPYVDQPYVEVEDASDRDEASIETLKMLGYLD